MKIQAVFSLDDLVHFLCPIFAQAGGMKGQTIIGLTTYKKKIIKFFLSELSN
jgi:hypothetical protein